MIICTIKSPTNPDLILPVSSISSRMKTIPQASSINVVVPNGISYATELGLRLDGHIELSFNGIVFGFSDQIKSAPLYDGASASSLQINADGLYPTHTPGTITLTGVSYQQLNIDGGIIIRASFDPLITPESTVIYDGEDYLVDSITYSANGENSSMEININA